MLSLCEPLDDAILVRPIASPKRTQGGLILPDSSQETFNRGVVEKTGPGDGEHPMPVYVGDLVFFGKFAGTWLSLFGADRLMLRASEVMLRIPAGLIGTVAHPTEKTEHLAGEPCEVCDGPAPAADAPPAVDADEVAATDRLRALRNGLRIAGA